MSFPYVHTVQYLQNPDDMVSRYGAFAKAAVLIVTTAMFISVSKEFQPKVHELHLSQQPLSNSGRHIVGVDTRDQNVRKYSCKRRTLRRPIALFSNMVILPHHHSFVIYLDIHLQWERNKSHRRRLFLMSLARQLIGIPEQAHSRAAQISRLEIFRLIAVARRRCVTCDWTRDLKTKFCCRQCVLSTLASFANVVNLNDVF